MSFIGYAYRFATGLADTIIRRTEHQVLIDLGSAPAPIDLGSPRAPMQGGYALAQIPEVQIDLGTPRAPMQGGYAVAQIANTKNSDQKMKI